MMVLRARLVLLMLLLAVVPLATAGNHNGTGVEQVDEAQETVEEILDDEGSALDGFTQFLQDAGTGIRDGAADAGSLVGRAVAAVGRAFAAVAGALTGASGALAIGLGGATLWSLELVGTSVSGVGAVGGLIVAFAGRGIAAAGTGIGDGLAFVGIAYADLIGSLRPDAMPPVAFGAVVASGAAGSAGAGGWAGWSVLKRWGWVAGGFGIAGFSRIQDDQLLEHPVRNRIFSVIQESPGIHASQLARDVGVGWGTVSHHLDKLQKGHLVTTRKVNNQKCYFEQGGNISRMDMEVASAIKGDTAGRIAQFVHGNPMTSQKEMAAALGISAALASFHAKKLVSLGVLDRMRHGKETLLTTSQAMRRLLESDRSVAAAMAARQEDAMDYSA